MLWITLTVTGRQRELLDAVNFMIQEDGTYCILLLDGSQRQGKVSEIQFIDWVMAFDFIRDEDDCDSSDLLQGVETGFFNE